jgi:hypothetical protein
MIDNAAGITGCFVIAGTIRRFAQLQDTFGKVWNAAALELKSTIASETRAVLTLSELFGSSTASILLEFQSEDDVEGGKEREGKEINENCEIIHSCS